MDPISSMFDYCPTSACVRQIDGEPLRKLKEAAVRWGDLESSLSLIRASGLEYREVGGSLFKNPNYEITRKDSAFGKSDVLLSATNAADLIRWVQFHLC